MHNFKLAGNRADAAGTGTRASVADRKKGGQARLSLLSGGRVGARREEEEEEEEVRARRQPPFIPPPERALYLALILFSAPSSTWPWMAPGGAGEASTQGRPAPEILKADMDMLIWKGCAPARSGVAVPERVTGCSGLVRGVCGSGARR